MVSWCGHFSRICSGVAGVGSEHTGHNGLICGYFCARVAPQGTFMLHSWYRKVCGMGAWVCLAQDCQEGLVNERWWLRKFVRAVMWAEFEGIGGGCCTSVLYMDLYVWGIRAPCGSSRVNWGSEKQCSGSSGIGSWVAWPARVSH